ncbi:hypothetical protein BESB_010350 [Besnoitia besnoiti]|uniref:Uncharacterized protein n=1 Tax=Besnoitia besnoiti TaxID=94643 RepID=A0A2A9MQR5_BESBE|nr:hypothetical protein BESB_010350 [Besnoitia besnoiti]PFH38693.1 hypothetical protein BESB_010350 [Besnoitia besnoiti]
MMAASQALLYVPSSRSLLAWPSRRFSTSAAICTSRSAHVPSPPVSSARSSSHSLPSFAAFHSSPSSFSTRSRALAACGSLSPSISPASFPVSFLLSQPCLRGTQSRAAAVAGRRYFSSKRQEDAAATSSEQAQAASHAKPDVPEHVACASSLSPAAAAPLSPSQHSAHDVIAELSQAGRFPRPPAPENAPSGGRARLRGVLLFLAATCLPVVTAAAMFKAAISLKKQERDEAVQALQDEESILRAAMDVVSGGARCFCLPVDSDGELKATIPLEPHLPESGLLRLPEKDVIPGVRNNALTDLFVAKQSEFSLPFNFIHFALHRSGAVYKTLTSHPTQGTDSKNPKEKASGKSKTDGATTSHAALSLLYVQPSRGASVLLSGFAVSVTAPEYRRHYWKNTWAATIPGGETSKDYVLMKFVPVSLQLHLPAACGAPCAGPEGAVSLRRFVSDTEVKWIFASPPAASA